MAVTTLPLRLLAAAAFATAAVACGLPQGGQDIGTHVEDSTTTRTIRARFADAPGVHFGDVRVFTLNGNVRLTGRVNSERERRRASRIARGADGVHAVENDIAVRPLVAPAPLELAEPLSRP